MHVEPKHWCHISIGNVEQPVEHVELTSGSVGRAALRALIIDVMHITIGNEGRYVA